MTIQHCDTMLGAVTTGIQHCNVQFGKTWNIATLEQSTADGNASWGTSPNYWSSSATNDWSDNTWKLTPSDSRGGGNLRVTVYVDSGSVPIMKIMASPYENPDLSGNTSSPYGTIYAGNTYVFPGSPKDYQTGYFCMTTGWAGSWSISAHITKIEWRETNKDYYTIWEE